MELTGEAKTGLGVRGFPIFHSSISRSFRARFCRWPVAGLSARFPRVSEPASTTLPQGRPRSTGIQLLSPAGDAEAGYAAIHYGADAVYCGLPQFSARAEAVNLTPDELSELVGFAHSRTPRRAVFVTVNTLVLQQEIPALVECLALLEQLGVDAVIVQDLGVFRIVRQHFPSLPLHASTQMAIHNLAGARALARLGFKRVTLARELTIEEIREIAASSGLETEVFIHGALCYSYSGLCLFSSHTRGRSGNRGRCAYPCRELFRAAGAGPNAGAYPFSMKDLALPDDVAALREAGVSCLKIEGRKKSPLYVGAVTDFYRRILDGKISASDRRRAEEDLKTIFSRPWTPLYVRSRRLRTAVDPDWTGHRGVQIGRVEAVFKRRGARPTVRLRTARAVEWHDGLQIDLPGGGRPFGFPVDALHIVPPDPRQKFKEVFAAPARSLIEVGLPDDHPDIPVGAPVYCSSSQAVKQRFSFPRPRPREFRVRCPIDVTVAIGPAALSASAATLARSPVRAEATVPAEKPFSEAKDASGLEDAIRKAFAKLGDTPFALSRLTVLNPESRFVPVSALNALRRQLMADLESQKRLADPRTVQALQEQIQRSEASLRAASPDSTVPPESPAWSLKVDRATLLDVLDAPDMEGIAEVILEIAVDPLDGIREALGRLGSRIPTERVRLALPVITRSWETELLTAKIAALRADGWRRWEAANLSGFDWLRDEGPSDLDIGADWPLYTLNRLAARQLLDMGASSFTLSPEDGLDNMRTLLAEFGDRAVVIVYQDTPLFISETCGIAGLRRNCPGDSSRHSAAVDIESNTGEPATISARQCRTVVFRRGAFCLAPCLRELAEAGARKLRVDFTRRNYTLSEVRSLWPLLRGGHQPPECHLANFHRGMR